jgi:hypothetical protein
MRNSNHQLALGVRDARLMHGLVGGKNIMGMTGRPICQAVAAVGKNYSVHQLHVWQCWLVQTLFVAFSFYYRGTG